MCYCADEITEEAESIIKNHTKKLWANRVAPSWATSKDVHEDGARLDIRIDTVNTLKQ